MEDSEIQKRIIKLGKEIVKELGLDPGVDTLARWMAHYIAEHIENAENAEFEDEKIEIRQRCFEIILELWQHRGVFPSGNRPFENFESIFRALEELDPENKKNYYFNFNNRYVSVDPNVKQWVDLAHDIDYVARTLLEQVFKEAVLCAKDKKTRDWLNHSIGYEDEVTTIRLINRSVDSNTKKQIIKSRIEKIKSINKFNRQLISILEKELKDIPEEP